MSRRTSASWRVVQRSTEPADRDRAEAAIGGLYAGRGLEAPRSCGSRRRPPASWRGTWRHAAGSRSRNPYTRGDRGTGDNQPFNALADPFAPEPQWTRRTAAATDRLLPEPLREPPTEPRGWRPTPTFARIAGRLGLVVERARVHRRGHPGPARPAPRWPAGSGDVPRAGAAWPRDPGLARLVVGARWDELEALIGPRLLEQVALDGIARAVADLLDPASSVRDALQAMNAGQFDAELAATRLLPDVLGVPRIASRSAATVGPPPGRSRRSAGPWWALERPGHRVGATAPAVARRAGPAALRPTDRPSPTRTASRSGRTTG